MNTLLNIDQELFFFINNICHTPFLNGLMPYWRSMYFWIPLYTFFVVYMVDKFGKNGWIYLLVLGLTVAISDPMSSRVFKKT